jgi:DNA gyrase/topoisomerase IV subunit A
MLDGESVSEKKLEELKKEIGMLKKEITSINKMFAIIKEPIIIERLDEKSLTKEKRKAIEEAAENFRKREKVKFLELRRF